MPSFETLILGCINKSLKLSRVDYCCNHVPDFIDRH